MDFSRFLVDSRPLTRYGRVAARPLPLDRGRRLRGGKENGMHRNEKHCCEEQLESKASSEDPQAGEPDDKEVSAADLEMAKEICRFVAGRASSSIITSVGRGLSPISMCGRRWLESRRGCLSVRSNRVSPLTQAGNSASCHAERTVSGSDLPIPEAASGHHRGLPPLLAAPFSSFESSPTVG